MDKIKTTEIEFNRAPIEEAGFIKGIEAAASALEKYKIPAIKDLSSLQVNYNKLVSEFQATIRATKNVP
jgi:hypothetical protein